MPAPDLRDVLARVEENLLANGMRMLREGAAPPPGAIGVAPGPPDRPDHWMFILFEVIDLQQRHELLRAGIETAGLLGFVFMFDGFVQGEDGRHEALLAVSVTPTFRRARAVVYWRAIDGLRIADPIEAPDDIALPYQRLFARAGADAASRPLDGRPPAGDREPSRTPGTS